MHVSPPNLKGLIAPAFTPFRADGSLDLPAVDRLAGHFFDRGLAGVFVAGTSGEGLSLSVAERQQLLGVDVGVERDHRRIGPDLHSPAAGIGDHAQHLSFQAQNRHSKCSGSAVWRDSSSPASQARRICTALSLAA